MKKRKILVTGGTGMLGRSLKAIIPDAQYLSSEDCDLTNLEESINFFKNQKPDIVIHAAARVGGIVANMSSPVEFLEDNIYINTNTCKASYLSGVKKFIGVLSTCIYPDSLESNLYPMSEKQLFNGPPPQQNFAYAYAKRSLAVQIQSYREQYKLDNWCYIIPCNLYGEYDKFDFQRSHFVSALIDKIYNSKNNKINLLGTGKPLRQFMYSADLALALKCLIDKDIYKDFNIATSEVLSIDEITNVALKSLNCDNFEVDYTNIKNEDGNFRKDVSSEKFLRYFPNFRFTPLSDGIKKVYKHYEKNYREI
tara:strand:- start:6234 stop:7160 length:927 start_codon:yes stop_codon:yes gene_type:complete